MNKLPLGLRPGVHAERFFRKCGFPVRRTTTTSNWPCSASSPTACWTYPDTLGAAPDQRGPLGNGRLQRPGAVGVLRRRGRGGHVLEVDLAAAAASDHLSDTVDYGPLVDICRSVVEMESYRLLERIAGRIAERVLASAGIRACTVRVRKLAVPLDADLDFAQVEIRRGR